jgi:hypothetical protein
MSDCKKFRGGYQCEGSEATIFTSEVGTPDHVVIVAFSVEAQWSVSRVMSIGLAL